MTIFVPPEDIAKRKKIRLSPDKSRYLKTVLRCKKGEKIPVIDGRGKSYDAEISEISQKNVFVDIIAELPVNTESAAHIILCQGILKGEKMDMVVQKATELGVREIAPIITERCLVRETKKTKRWGKIAEEAAEQCGRAVIPAIHKPAEFRAWFAARGSLPMNGLIFWEEGGLPLAEAVHKISSSPIHIFIGPEGGFTSGETAIAEKHGLVRTTLGRRILRAETAAIVSVALAQFLIEDRRRGKQQP